jgi:hypothetical protein
MSVYSMNSTLRMMFMQHIDTSAASCTAQAQAT